MLILLNNSNMAACDKTPMPTLLPRLHRANLFGS